MVSTMKCVIDFHYDDRNGCFLFACLQWLGGMVCWTVGESVTDISMQSQRAKKCKLWPDNGHDAVEQQQQQQSRHHADLCSPLQPFFHQVIGSWHSQLIHQLSPSYSSVELCSWPRRAYNFILRYAKSNDTSRIMMIFVMNYIRMKTITLVVIEWLSCCNKPVRWYTARNWQSIKGSYWIENWLLLNDRSEVTRSSCSWINRRCASRWYRANWVSIWTPRPRFRTSFRTTKVSRKTFNRIGRVFHREPLREREGERERARKSKKIKKKYPSQ